MIIEGGNTALSDVAKSFTQFIHDMNPTKLECLNGGVLSLNGKECACTMKWTGRRCENIVCLNGGKVVEAGPEKTKECRCRLFIGPHCETTTCLNGGKPLADASGCVCNSIYTGKFCESNIFITIAIPALILFVFIGCVFFIYRRRSFSSSDRNAPRACRVYSSDHRRHQTAFLYEQPPQIEGAYSIGSDITLNPQMIGSIEEGKILMPLPSYDEAMNARCTFEPPRYHEQPSEGSQVRGMTDDEGEKRNILQ